MEKEKTVIVICGPTAVGKTAFAIRLAQQLQTQIISADSRQCFKELNIGVAKPNHRELNTVEHYFINSHSIFEEVNAVVFEQYALQAVAKILENNDVAVMVGGTGLYIKAFCDGLDNIPAIDPDIRNNLNSQYQEKGIAFLQSELQTKDPAFWQLAEQQNPQRLLRALEVLLSTGKSIQFYKTGIQQKRPFKIIKIGLELPRLLLYERINRRVDSMVKDGLIKEVEGLLSHRLINALQTVGYKELFEYFDRKTSLDEAVEKIKIHTRNYAKRQLTWFKKDVAVVWHQPDESAESISKTLENYNR